jgi:hypothetical protein
MTHHEAETGKKCSTEQIETIVVSVDDIIEALRFKNEPTKNQRTVSIRIHPPFSPVVEASIHYTQDSHYYPPDLEPRPLHINPTRFLDGEGIEFPVRSLERDRARTEMEDPSDEEIEGYADIAVNVWEDDIRSRLADELKEPIYNRRYPIDTASIEWEDPE